MPPADQQTNLAGSAPAAAEEGAVRPLRIGYLAQAGVPDLRRRPLSGAALHLCEVFRELGRRGHRVRLLAQLDRELFVTDDLQSWERVRVPALDRGPLRWCERVVRRLQSELRLPYAALFDSIRFAAACRRCLNGVDVLYERMGWAGYAGVLAARRLGVPLVLEVNGDHLVELAHLGLAPRGLQLRLSSMLMGAAVRGAAHSIASGEGWRRSLVERWNVDPRRTTVVDNGSTLVGLLGRDKLQCFRPGRDDQPLTVAYAGGFQPWHGIELLIDAFAAARARGARARLVLFGRGPREAAIRERIAALGLDADVRVCGYLEPAELGERLAEAHIAVSPYCGRAEFTGLKLADYMAAGLAAVASGAGGEPRVIEHGRTGWIVPPGDAAALRDALVLLCASPELVRRMGREARGVAESRYTWSRTVEQIEAVLRQVTAR